MRYLIPLSAYFILTILMTWPTALHLTDGIPGDGFDGWQNYWNLWWVKQALLVEQTTPYYSTYLYPPEGVSLLFHTLNIFNGLWTLPLQLNFGLAVAYNSVVFFSFTLAGFGGYLLSLYVLTVGEPLTTLHKHKRIDATGVKTNSIDYANTKYGAAFVGGLIFTMSPFHMAHLLGHMQVFSMVWPPFYLLWLLKILQPWYSPHPDYRDSDASQIINNKQWWQNVGLCVLFLGLTTTVALYHTLYLLIFTAITLLWTIGHRGGFKQIKQSILPLTTVLTIGFLFAVIMSPLLIPMVLNASSRPDLETGLAQNIALSADLLAFITPSEMHPLWGEWAKTIANNFSSTTSERLIFAGFVPLLLASFAVITMWRRNVVKYWFTICLTYFLLALGPYLQVNGQMVSTIPLPYWFLYHTVPFINLTRSLSRYDLIIMLALGVLTALSLVKIVTTYKLQRVSKHKTAASYGFIGLVIALICFEFMVVPYPISMIDTPPFFYEIGADKADYTIAELPMNWDRPTPLLHQTAHGKRLLTAYTSRNNPSERAWRTPVLQQWRYLGLDIIDHPLDEIAPTVFYDMNLRYIVLDYWQMPPGPERAGTEQWVQAALPNSPPIYDDGRLKVYHTPQKTETRPYLSFGEGWGSRQVDGNEVTRSINKTAFLGLHHPDIAPLMLNIEAKVFEAPTELIIKLNDVEIKRLMLTSDYQQYVVPLGQLTAEFAEIGLMVDDSVIVRRLGLD